MNTHELYVQANNFLNNILNDSTLYWRQNIKTLYPESAEKSIKNIITYANKNDCVHIECGIRFISGSLNILAEKYMPDLLPSESGKVLNILKEKKRILQLGSGRGKGFIIFSHEYLEEEMNNEPIHLVDPADPSALVKALKDNFIDKNNDIKALRVTVTEQQKRIENQEEQINHLQTQVANVFQRSWS